MPPTETRQVILRGAAGSLATRALGTAAALGMSLLLTRTLTLAGFGLIVTALSWTTIAGTVACFGSNTVATRIVAEALARGEERVASAVVRWGLRRALAAGIIGALSSAGIALLVFHSWPLSHKALLVLGLLTVPAFSAGLHLSGALNGAKRVISAAGVETVVRPVAVTAFVALVASVFPAPLPVWIAMAGLIGAQVLAVVFGWLRLPKPLRAGSEVSSNVVATWAGIGLPIGLTNAMAVFTANVDVLFLAYWRGTEAAGLYRPAVQVANLVSFMLAASNAIVAPVIAELYWSGRTSELQRALRLASAMVSVVAVVAGTVLSLTGKFVLGLFGTSFVAVYPALLILLAGQLLNALSGPTGVFMSMSGHERQAMWIFAASTAIVIVLNLVLVPLFGALGAALATAAGMASWNIPIVLFLRRHLQVDPSLLGWLRPPLRVSRLGA